MSLFKVRADLHVHTCLSPCGELEMTPVHIVERCKELGIGLIAVCDHNTAKNVQGVTAAAERTDLKVLAGMEVTTEEEVHILAIFDTTEQALELQKEVYGHLQPGENNDELFGMQVVANELDEVEAFEYRLLIGSTTLPLEEAVGIIHSIGGLAIASHIDRPSYSLIGQLGIIPDDLMLDGVEVSAKGDMEAMLNYPGVNRFPIIRSSDCHSLKDMGQAWTDLTLADLTVAELKMAFLNQARRTAETGVAAA